MWRPVEFTRDPSAPEPEGAPVDSEQVRDGAAAPGCDVVVLVPHPTSAEMLVRQPPVGERDGGYGLPSTVLAPEPETSDIVRAVSQLLGTQVTLLRANTMTWHDNFDSASMVVEVEPISSAVPEQFRWLQVEPSAVEVLSPPWAADVVAAWLAERTSGWSPLRPQWSRPGWLSRAGAWMKDQMLRAGYERSEDPQIHWIWGVSVVLSASSASGTAYLKCSSDRFLTEPVVTRALAQHFPAMLPQVFAIDEDRGWMLMRDMRGTPLGDQPPAVWGQGLAALQQLQEYWLGRTHELIDLGAENRPLATLALWVENTIDDTDLMNRLTSDQRRAWSRSVPTMVEACRQLDTGGPGPTLVHGDFHPWNVLATEDGVRIFDWTDASVSHPFVDLVTYIGRGDDLEVRQRLVQLYLTKWDANLHGPALADLTRRALVVGSLHQAHTYCQLIPTVMPEDVGHLRDGDAGWIARAMRFAKEGHGAKY